MERCLSTDAKLYTPPKVTEHMAPIFRPFHQNSQSLLENNEETPLPKSRVECLNSPVMTSSGNTAAAVDLTGELDVTKPSIGNTSLDVVDPQMSLKDYEQAAFDSMKKLKSKPAACKATIAACNTTLHTNYMVLLGCARCRGSTTGCAVCKDRNFKGIRIHGKEAWHNHHNKTQAIKKKTKH